MTESAQPIGGKYRLIRQLATGGMGTVHEALHLHTRGRVAIKILSDEAKKDDASRARFAREAAASGRLRSRHVARVIDVDALDDGTPYLVMEYLEGEDLSRLLKTRGPLPLAEIASILIQACAGVAEAHSHGIVHRDLKPGNIFLAREGASQIVKVLDFGISKVPNDEDADALTRTFSTIGTPGYMSPEQIRAPKEVDAATDVWSIGVMLYRLLTGSLPFSGNASSIAVAICHEPPKTISIALPADIRALLDATLRKDRDARPSIRDVAEALVAHLPDDATIAREAWAELSRLDLPQRIAPLTPLSEPTLAATHHGVTEKTPRRARWPFAIAGAVAVAGIAFAATRSTPQAAPAPGVAAPTPSSSPSPDPLAPLVPSVAPSASSSQAIATASNSAKPPPTPTPTPAKPKPTSNAATSIPARL